MPGSQTVLLLNSAIAEPLRWDQSRFLGGQPHNGWQVEMVPRLHGPFRIVAATTSAIDGSPPFFTVFRAL
jgi:hypothetical protein